MRQLLVLAGLGVVQAAVVLAPLLSPELVVLSLLLLAGVRAAHIEAEVGKDRRKQAAVVLLSLPQLILGATGVLLQQNDAEAVPAVLMVHGWPLFTWVYIA